MKYTLIQSVANWSIVLGFAWALTYGVVRGRLNIIGITKSIGRIQIRRVKKVGLQCY
jgi:hypothetical protein